MLIATKSMLDIMSLKTQLIAKFDVKDMGAIKKILRMGRRQTIKEVVSILNEIYCKSA